MEDNLIAILETFKVPVYRQGSLAGDYPEEFITFWHRDTTSLQFYDNGEEGIAEAEAFDVNVYGVNPTGVYSLLSDIVAALWAAGWAIPDRGHDVASDEATHIGRGISATKRKEI